MFAGVMERNFEGVGEGGLSSRWQTGEPDYARFLPKQVGAVVDAE
ncbi:hypothetical protein PAMC26510_26355 [Caballeronia sordidicola]|uniref:Uncharacterized protein n=1 Tax=Caballeronia sordidicola TaxID=196367 RepID=A0A242ME40_CABSO|nr:hypothetical protein PAMC26510_26355 [Caballeronia sordidicola]